MFLKINCVDYISDKKTVELCSFRGIRYDRRTNSAVLSTEHDNHDYVFPIGESEYERLVLEIEKAIKANASMISFENGEVYRCKKGQVIRTTSQNSMVVR